MANITAKQIIEGLRQINPDLVNEIYETIKAEKEAAANKQMTAEVELQ